MKKVSVLEIVIEVIFGHVAVFRICTGKNEVFDYIVVVFTVGILVYDITKLVKSRKAQKESEELQK